LSYNDLGPETISILTPILSSIITLNLNGTKLNNESMQDLARCFKIQEMKLQELQLQANLISTEGLYALLVCLKTNNKVKTLNISKNDIAKDLKQFKMV